MLGLRYKHSRRPPTWVLLLLFCGLRAPASDAVYQFSVPASGRTTYLWVPPQCSRVRGVIMAFSNMLERRWLEDPIVREAAAQECLGTIWIGGDRNSALKAEMTGDSPKAFEQMMLDLAAISGFKELAWAPVIPTGHSAQGQFAWDFARAEPERTIAAVAIKTTPLPSDLSLPGIPFLYMVGETTEWPQYRDGRIGNRDFFWPEVRDSAIRLRTSNPENLVGVVTDPGGGHFDWSDRQARFLALFIRKACALRLPRDPERAGPIHLRAIRPETGWLTDTGGVQPDKHAAAPYGRYTGEKNKAYWFFDQTIAEAAVTFDGDRKQRQHQMLTFEQDGSLLPVAKEGFAPLKFEPEADGITFRLKAAFLTAIPEELVDAGRPLNHANGHIRLSVITGPVEQVGPEEFRLAMRRGDTGGDIWIEEQQDGDARFRKAVQPGRVHIPAPGGEGDAQTIAFDPIPDQQPGMQHIQLQAHSSSGLPVRWYVDYGPARVDGDVLTIDQLPVYAKLPIAIRVVAYQWGPPGAVQPAETVAHTFNIMQGGAKQK